MIDTLPGLELLRDMLSSSACAYALVVGYELLVEVFHDHGHMSKRATRLLEGNGIVQCGGASH